MQRPQPGDLNALDGTEQFLSDDAYLRPVIEGDPLLLREYTLGPFFTCPTMTTTELLQADEWSDNDNDNDNASPAARSKDDQDSQPLDLNHALLEIKRLKEHLQAARQDLTDYRALVNKNITNIAGGALGDMTADEIRKEELPPTPPRDDDTHYFESYSDQGGAQISFFKRSRY